MMLDTTRSGTFVAGSNRVAAASGAAWLALLPTQEPGAVLVLGVPSRPVLTALAGTAGALTIRCRTRREARRARAILAGTSAKVDVGAIPEGIFDLIVISRSESRSLAAAAQRLAKQGVVVVEESGTARRDHGPEITTRLVLRPSFGEITAAVPESTSNARRALERRGLWSRAVVIRAFGRSREVAGPWLRGLPERRLVVASSGPPAYLRRIGAEAGVDVGGFDWAMSAPGRYRSNKISFFLFEPGSDVPRIVVKTTRDRDLNGRLDVEREALEHLNAAGVVGPATIPSVVFSGLEGGRAVLGLTAIAGTPFTVKTLASAECPHAARAFSWLVDLGASTAAHSPGAGSELAGHLRDILERFAGLYDVDARYRSVLEDQIRGIERCASPFPVVFQHGDPGAWNLLVGENGTVAFLDWEAAERRGVPLWDVFHLARSYAVVAGRAAGERNMMRSIERILYTPSPINRMVADVIGRYRERVGVPEELVEPLFHTSWMHRALKEATRLPKERLGSGHYLALLRRGIDLRETPGVRKLLGGGAG
jgi:hypothetical protein